MRTGLLGRLWSGWIEVQQSYWLLPALLVLGTAGTAVGTLQIDRRLGSRGPQLPWWLYEGGADGAREVLATTGGATLTLAGVSFSATVVALSLAANQFGPRLLRTFMRDRGTQAVLGVLLGTFVFCLLILRSVHGDQESDVRFVPHVSVTVAVALAVVSVGMFIFFVHHIAAQIQAPHVIASVGQDLRRAIDRIYPEPEPEAGGPGAGEPAPPLDDWPAVDDPGWLSIVADEEGYIERLDRRALLRTARARDLRLVICRRPGESVVEGMTVLRVWPAARAASPVPGELLATLVVGAQRSWEEDLLFPVEQLAEMALRALSAGINDPYTASQCVDQLGAGLSRLAARRIPSGREVDEDGRPRLLGRPVTVPDVLTAGLEPIREHAGGRTVVLRTLVEVLERLAQVAHRPGDRRAIALQAEAVAREGATDPTVIGRAAQLAAALSWPDWTPVR